MKLIQRITLFAFASAILMFALGGAAHAQDKPGTQQVEPGALVEALKSGGNVIYFRHAATDQAQQDSSPVDFKSCATQRNLSDKGKEQASTIGKTFGLLGVKVSKVYASPYCRAVDTAKLAFGEVTVVPDLEFAIAKSEAEAKRLGRVLRKMLENQPPKGTNTVIVAHSANLKEAIDIFPQPEGVAHIFRYQDGRLTHVGRVPPEQWAALAKNK
ncbi:MAG: histidine phosphatase family protein [Pseudomonadota bacterium]